MDQRFFFAAEKSSQKFLDLSNILCREGGGGRCMNQKPIFVNRNFLECCGYPAYLKTGYLAKFSVRPDAIHPTPDNGRKLFFIPDIRHFR